MGSYGLKRLNGRPLVNPDGTTSVYCQTCGREICRRTNCSITSIKMCAICQGAPEENVVAPYSQASIDSPPIPHSADRDYLFLYGGLESIDSGIPPEKIGTMQTIFRALGLQKLKDVVIAESKKVAIRKRRKSVFSEPEEE